MELIFTTLQPTLKPLADSHDASDLDAETKALFMDLFESYIRITERRINTYGTPHLGDITVIERAIKQDGLSLFRRDDTTDKFMAEILRGWRSIHSRRGLGFLRFYLQMLWPNAFEIKDYWQIKNVAYPNGLSIIEGPDKFLTSRKIVHLFAGQVTDPTEVVKIQAALRQIVPARIVLDIALMLGFQNSESNTEVLMAGAGATSLVISFEDTTIDSTTIVNV